MKSSLTSSASVLCAGILVADVFVPAMASLPAEGQLLATDDFLPDSGGCAANVATSLSRLGVPATVCGRIGRDVFGDFILTDLKAKGVDVSGIRRSTKLGTSKTLILPVVGEDRRYIHTFGANAEFSEEDLDTAFIQKAAILYLGGLLIMPSLTAEAVANLFRQARAMKTTTVLDIVVPAGDASAALRSLATILPYTDYFLPNDDEARVTTGISEPLEQARMFHNLGCETVLITRGKNGALLMSSSEVLDAPAYEVDMVDGSGAGDAFAAGFITGLLEGWDMEAALRFASAIGSSACTRLGCTTGVFTRREADEFITRNPLLIQRRSVDGS